MAKSQSLSKVNGVPEWDTVILGTDVTAAPKQCASMSLQDDVALEVFASHWWGQTGAWSPSFDQNAGAIADWSLSYGNMSWKIGIRNRSTVQLVSFAEVVTDDVLKSRFGWVPMPLPVNLTIKMDFQEHHAALVMSSHLQELNTSISLVHGDPSVVMLNVSNLPQANPRSNVVLTDCEGTLLYVVSLWESPGFLKQPTTIGIIEIYNEPGRLIAYSVREPDYHKYLFVEPERGYLLATAESPAIGLNITFQDVPTDPYKGDVRTYGMHFERGGYVGASPLMNEDLRWVIAAAVQARALRDAHQLLALWQPTFIYWWLQCQPLLFCLLTMVVLLCIMAAYWHWAHKDKDKLHPVMPSAHRVSETQRAALGPSRL